jgi:PAS domain S-box-containing protein
MTKKSTPDPIGIRTEADFLKLLQELQIHQIELDMQNRELILASERAEIAATRYAELYDFAPIAYFTLRRDGEITQINLNGASILGIERSFLKGRLFGNFVERESTPGFKLFLENAFSSYAKETCELILETREGQQIYLHLTGVVIKNSEQCRVVALDISERKQTENYREISRKILKVLNEPGKLKEAIVRVLDILKLQTRVDACGIRLQEGSDYPYIAQKGFSEDFLMTENSILGRTKDGGICHDPDGKVSLNCTCGMVITGKVDDDNPFFTPGGSVWTNDSIPFLDLPSDEDPRLNPRNQCIHHGFASVALIPIRTRNRNVGLIQFNSRIKGAFNHIVIEQLEEIASHIGEALMRKADEELLHESHQILSAFMNSAPFFAFVKEVTPTKSVVLKASENFREMIGIPGSEMIGKNMFDLFPADLAQKMTDNDWTIVAENKIVEFNESLNGRDYATSKFPIFIGGKHLLAGYSLDVTDRNLLERKLIESEKQYRILVDTAQEGVVVVQGGFFRFVNPRMINTTGYSEEELLILPFLDIVFDDDKELAISNYRARMAGNPVADRYQLRALKKDRSIIWVEISGVQVEWQGEPAIIYFVIDITDRKRIEEEIQLKTHELQKLNAEKDKYFSIIAHDLRSPFQTLLGISSQSAEELLILPEEKVRKIAVNMRKSASRLFDLLENLLEWSQIQRGIITFKPRLFRAADTFTRIAAMVRLTANKKMIKISLDVPDDLKIYADEQMFESLIRNFAYNAVKFTPKGGEVNIRAIIMPDNTVHISITDNGIGMSQEMLGKLFLMEEQVTRKGTDGEPSTGLGLVICRDFIEKHGGELWIESVEDKGSTFTFSLPVPVRK